MMYHPGRQFKDRLVLNMNKRTVYISAQSGILQCEGALLKERMLQFQRLRMPCISLEMGLSHNNGEG